nr:VCBS domain-containing protein [Bradyrhizobium niftali]
MSGYSAADLLTQDTARAEATSSDTSLNGAKIWITADGKVGYDASALSAQIAALSAGEFFTDSFIYAIRLGNGTLSWATATVRIAGVNDGPVAVADTNAVKEDTASNSVSGSVLINDTDTDTHDSHGVTAVNGSATKVGSDVVGTYGTLHLNSDGTYTYTLNNAQANVQALAAGQLVYDTFSYTNSDNHGGSSIANLTITVTGTNDAPVITSSAQSGLATEWADLSAAEVANSPHTAFGAVTFTDVDTLDSHTASFAPQGGGYLGTFTLDTTNHDTGNGGAIGWSFSVSDGAIDYLQAGQTLTQKYDVTISDGHGGTAVQTVTMTIVGTNDAPVITSAAQSGLATEWADLSAAEVANSPHTAFGAVAFTDVDTLDSHTASFAPQGGGYLGTFTLDTTNHDTGNGGAIGWSFSVSDGAIDYLQAGQTLTQKYDVTISDGHGGTAVQTVTMTIVGTNDAPVITSAAQSGTVSEGDDLPAAAQTATGQVTFSDVDTSDTHTLSVSVAAAHGTATVDPDGTWHYTVLDSGGVDALAAGEHLADSFTVEVDDHHGGLASQVVSIDITGTNDAPVAVADTNAGSEDSTITGTVASNDSDVDDGAILTYAQTSAVAGLTLHPNGSYSFDAGNAAYQHLAQGATADVVANYTVTDEHGATSGATLTITLTGTNDAPVAVADTNAGLEDSTITGTVASNDSDVDDGAILTYAQTGAVAGLTLNPNGSYSLDAANAAYQHLAQGATADVVANYTVTDEHGATSGATLTITLTGTNDAPVAVADTNAGSEDSTITGTVAGNDSDVDDGATLSYSLDAAVAGLTLNPNGSYSFDAGHAAYQHLAQGATADVVANYTVTDEHGATSGATLTITLTGTNDAPVAVADTNAGSEDSTITGTVASNDSDVDDGATLSYSLDAAVAGLTLNPNGSYSFDAGHAAYQHLAQGATADVVANYTVTDEHGATSSSTLTITLTGTNDAPVAAADTNAGSEDSTITGTVAANDSDVDDGAVLTYAQTGAVAGLTINADGSYSLDAANAAYQHLAQGATADVVANYTVTDEHGATSGATLTITLTGTNDAPVAVADANAGLEDSTITGTVAGNDGDVDDGATLSYSLDAAVAGLTLNPNGSYSFDAGHPAYQHLAQGATTDVVANYTVTDEHGATSGATLTITLTGTNDAPVAVADTNAGSEDSTITGTVASNDSDVDDGATLSYSLDAAVAGLTLNPNGSYSFDAGHAAYQHLAQGATADVVANYTVTDEHGATSGATLTITLTGTNDAPVAVADTNAGLEDSTITGSVASNDSDVDDGAILTYAQTGAVAGLTINPDGSYSLDAGNPAYQHLAQGATADVVANYTVTDEHGATSSSTLTITLTGTNDAPVAAADTNAGSEDSTITGSVAANDSDVDDGAVLTYAQTGAVAGLTINADGSYSLDAANAAYQHLAQGATADVVANYTVTDEHGATSGATLTITLTGTNDAPVAVADTNAGSEDSTITGTVAGNDSDIDDGAVLTYAQTGAVAGLTLNPDGSYSLDAGNAAYQHLAQGATTDVVANYTVTDEHGATSGATLTITLTGTNDAPVAVADANAGLEDSTITGTVASNDSDVDDGAVLTYAQTGAVAGLTLHPDGSYSFDAGNPTYQHLAQGATTDVVANYTVTDEHGATSGATLTITLTGTNDAPVAVADTNSGLEDSTITGTVASNDSDVDDGATLSYSLDAAVAGLTLNPNGSYSFDAGHAAYQHLAQGATADVVANYTVTDEHGATSSSSLTITLTGTNDTPVAVADTNAGLEDSTITGTVASNDSDVDDGATLSYSLDAAVAGLTLNPNGSYSFDAGNPTYQHLAQGATTDVVANYTVTDEHGATSGATLTITLTGTNDAPVAVADTNAGSEDSTITGTVASNDSDIDDGAVLTYAQTGAVAGLTLNPDGSYSLDAGNAAYQHLAQGATADVVANYTVTDEHGATSGATLTITLTGTNDAPVAVADANAGLEDSTITGTVAGNDGDVDDGAVLTYAQTGAVAGLTLHPDGSYSFDAGNPTYQHLAQGATTDVVANYTVTDEHGATSGASLTITLTGTNDAPVAVADTNAGLEDSTITGSVASNDSDVDDGAILTYAQTGAVAGLTINPDGSYSLDAGNPAYQHLAQGATADVVANYTVTDEHGATSGATLTITLTGTNDAPVVVAGHALNYTENQAATAIDPALTVSDVDNANLSSATVQITGNYVNGQDVLGFTNQNGITGSFNAATGTLTLTGSSSVANYQTALDSVTYLNTSDNPSGLARTVTIITNDGSANSLAVTDTINVTPVNDAPVVVVGHTLNYTENQAATAIDPALTVSDVDSANLSSATVQITGNYVNGQDVLGFTNQNGITGSFNAATGTLTLTGSSSVANYQTALDSVTYLNTSDNPSGLARTVTIITNDGAANSVAVTDTINVTPVNDAPVLNAAQTPVLTAENEDGGVPSGAVGTLVSSLVSLSGGVNNVTDVDSGAVTGLALTATDTAHGSWFYSTNGGTSWTAVGTVTNTSALLLAADANTRLYFQPAADFNGTDTNAITFRAWDQTSGAAGTKVDASTNGGTTAFSTATDTANIVINPVNDAPIASGSATLAAINEDTATPAGATVTSLFSGNFSDATDQVSGGSSANTFAGIAISSYTVDATKGNWQYSTNGGGSWTSLGNETTSAALTLNASDMLRFLPAANYNGSATALSANLIESGQSITSGATINLTGATGGSTHISSGTVALSETITAVNDAPIASGSATLPAINEDMAAPAGATVNSLFSGNFSDTADQVSGGSSANTFAGIAISSYTVDATKGNWQYSTNGGGSWTTLGNETTSAALTLNATDMLRFVPAANYNGSATALSANLIESGQTITSGASVNLTGATGGTTHISSGTVPLSETVSAVNDAPVNTVPATSVNAGNGSGTATFSGASLISISDVDAGNGSVTVSLSLGASAQSSTGILTLATTTGLAFNAGANATKAMTFTGTITDINNALNGMVFSGGSNNSTRTLTITTNDNGNSGSGGGLTDVDTVSVVKGNGSTTITPAGIAGEAINLALADQSIDHLVAVTANVSGIPSGWTLSEGAVNSDGSWTVVTNHIASLAITSPSNYTGALVLDVTETWINADGSAGAAIVADNIEVYAQGSPIFALSGDDNLTGSSGHDLFVFSQPIGHDVIYDFAAASDQIDLIGYANFTDFGDIQSHMTDDAAGNAVVTLADGQSITLKGVDALSLTADDFVFDQTPVTENAGHMVISDGAILPLSGIIDNTGTIELNSTGSGTDLELIEHGITLQGHGQVVLSDSSQNLITGTVSDVMLTNVDNTISGAGHLGDGVMVLVNEGTIIATGTNALDIDTGANAVTNTGTIEATGTGGLVVHSDVVNTGLLWANDGNVTIDGNVSGNGSALISGTATLEFAHASAENTTFATGATGTLILGDSFNFSGTVSGMSADDHIDLLDFNFANAPTLNYTPNADNSGGTLSIADGSHTANIALLGSFDPTGFQIEADKTTGTLVSYHDFHLA